jgi:tetratricopeptide (TPR) repeat protein
VLLAVPARAATKWTRLQTDNFLFIGDVSPRQLRQVAQRLEQFRDVMSRLLPDAAVTSSVPTTVFVFQTDQSLTPYKPRFEGRPIAVAGYFMARRDANYVTINAQSEQAALRIVFHEYAHFLVRNTTGDMPLWANEGLAGFYETFEDRQGGKGAMIGLPHESHLALLQHATLMPLPELMAVDHDSPVYNEGNRRGVFYAESWALMHYLMMGNPVRTAQLRDYLVQVKNGLAPEQAFSAAFGKDGDRLERELREYIRNFSFPVLRVEFGEKVVGAGVGSGAGMDDVDANAHLAELLINLDRVDEARGRLQKLMTTNPESARAVGALGMLQLKDGKIGEAVPLLERAAALDAADGAVQRALGSAFYARSLEPTSDDAAAAAARTQARAALGRAIDLLPGDADALAVLGRLESNADDHARATSLFERAVTIAPRQKHFQLLLAESLVRQQQYARATTYLGPLLADSTESDVKEAARDLLGFIGNQSKPLADVSLPAAATNGSAPPSATRRPAATPGRFNPDFRPVGAEERRVFGMFTRVDCVSGGIVLVVEADAETLRLAATEFSKVAFITYSNTGPGTVACGPVLPATRVFATFDEKDASMTTADVNGRAIAIEVLPDDFTPR